MSIRQGPEESVRSIANFTLHAILAAALAALAASAAAAGPAVSDEVFVKLPSGTNAGNGGEQLPVQSFQWGSDEATEPEAGPVKSRYFEAWSVEVEGAEGGDDQAAPPEQGSLKVKAEHPWPNCRVGARYPVLELSDGGRVTKLKDVTVSSCGAEEGITFVYGRLG